MSFGCGDDDEETAGGGTLIAGYRRKVRKLEKMLLL